MQEAIDRRVGFDENAEQVEIEYERSYSETDENEQMQQPMEISNEPLKLHRR